MLPFKHAESAHHAAPIEALEYLAGQKTVVATPVHDIVALHGHIVRLAADAQAFVEACRTAMCERGPLRRQRQIDALIAVHSCTWDRAAQRVHQLLVEIAREPSGEAADVAAALVASAVLRQGAITAQYARG
jgi:UDP-galactopyranose mutase